MIKRVEEKFCAFLEATSLSDDIDREHIYYLGHSYGRNNAFLGWSRQPYQDAIEEVQRTCRNVSEKAIANVLMASMVRLFEQQAVREDADPEAEARLDSILSILDRSAIREEVSSFLDFLRSQVRLYRVFIPIEGVELETTELKIGDVILYRSKSGPIVSDLASLMGDGPAWEHVEKTFGEVACYAIIEVEGESGFAKQQALQKAQDVVHILNLYLASCRHRPSWQKIGIIGQPTSWRDQVVVYIASQVGERRARPRAGWTMKAPPRRRYEIDRTKVRKWKEVGLDEISECFRYGDSAPDSIESRIRRSVTWYSKGVSADNSDEQFVSLAIALESLLVGSEGTDPKVSWGSITQRLAERVTFLIGRDYTSRVDLVKETKRLYRLRSKVVHAGQTVSQENVALMEYIVAKAILDFVGRKFDSWEKFLEWERQQKYGVGVQTVGVS